MTETELWTIWAAAALAVTGVLLYLAWREIRQAPLVEDDQPDKFSRTNDHPAHFPGLGHDESGRVARDDKGRFVRR